MNNGVDKMELTDQKKELFQDLEKVNNIGRLL